MKGNSFLAIDLGAESGRAILGRIDKQLTIEEIHRFSNGPVIVADHLHWDILYLWREIKNSIEIAFSSKESSICGIGLDTWGVDFGLFDSADKLIGNPYHYRDARTNGMVEAACQIVSREEIYRQTGIQFMQLNTLFQLFSMRQTNDPVLKIAKTLLTTPDLLNFWLTGQKASELTISTTTQCYNPRENNWAIELLDTLEIPKSIFQPIINPGIVIGNLRSSVAEEANCPKIPVLAIGSHDTASAVAAVPAQKDDFLFVSSGTWSLMGIESDHPIINPKSLECNLTNEGGVNKKTLILKNIMGLWLLQECRRLWVKADKGYSYDDLTTIASNAPALKSLIYVGENRFLAPANMVESIQSFCSETGQVIPQTDGEIVRCILESLALEYRWGKEKIGELTGKTFSTIHIIGGGSRNFLLDQFTADATGCEVVAGPVEATAIGNILVQAISLGYMTTLKEGRDLVRNSFNVTYFHPKNPTPWEDAFSRYLVLRP